MQQQVEMIQNNEVAIVRLTKDGRVEVIREGQPPTLLSSDYTLDTAVKKFEEHGWKPKEEKVVKTAEKNGVPLSIQQEVDEYLKLHAEKAKLESKMNSLKKDIRQYMENNDVTAIAGTEGKQVYLQEAKASNSTSIYTDYELNQVMMALNDNELLRKVTEIRVNAEKLEGLLKMGVLPENKVEEIRSLKIVKKGTPRFAVKK